MVLIGKMPFTPPFDLSKLSDAWLKIFPWVQVVRFP